MKLEVMKKSRWWEFYEIVTPCSDLFLFKFCVFGHLEKMYCLRVLVLCLYFDAWFYGFHKVKGETGGLKYRQKAFSKTKTVVFLIDTLHFETCVCVYTYIYINLSKHKEILHLILLQSVPAYLTLISFLKESTLHSRPLYKRVVLLILIQSDTHSNNTTSLLGFKTKFMAEHCEVHHLKMVSTQNI